MATATAAAPDAAAHVAAVVARLGVDRGADHALSRLARVLDARSGAARPPTPLVLPALDARASSRPSAVDRPDEELDDALEVAVAAVGAAAGPALLGQVHEVLLDAGHRRRRGAFYTPTDVAGGLVREVFARLPEGCPSVCDPALGGGVFLLAAADELVARGADPASVVEELLWGSDVDASAVAVAEAALVLWARSHGVDPGRVNVVCADALHDGADAWADPPAAGFGAVVGNPPFLNQLGAGTSRGADDAARLRDRWGPSVYRYTDTAAIFLRAATRLAAAGGVAAMIVPVPVLVTGDADRVRQELLDRAAPEHLWIAQDDVFGLGVRVCAPVLRVGGSAATGPVPVTRSQGRGFTPIEASSVDLVALRAAGTWGALVADAFGVPALGAPADRAGRLGDFCRATAGFRDQYYGLRSFVVETDRGSGGIDRPGVGRWPKLVTSGLVDPARMGWGERTSRFDGRRWTAPVVDLDALAAADASLAAWAVARLVPKVVVATQTRVLEAAVDVEGDWFPSVPTIAVVADEGRLWDAAAVILAPPTTAWAMQRHVGAALSADALKVSAKQLLDAPLPVDHGAWAHAVAHLRAASAAVEEETWRDALTRFGAEMTRAYAAPDQVLTWWLDRVPRWR